MEKRCCSVVWYLGNKSQILQLFRQSACTSGLIKVRQGPALNVGYVSTLSVWFSQPFFLPFLIHDNLSLYLVYVILSSMLYLVYVL